MLHFILKALKKLNFSSGRTTYKYNYLPTVTVNEQTIALEQTQTKHSKKENTKFDTEPILEHFLKPTAAMHLQLKLCDFNEEMEHTFRRLQSHTTVQYNS